MTKEETKKAIEVMQAYVDGKKIEFIIKDDCFDSWHDFSICPEWNFTKCNYRIKPEPKLRPYKNSEEFLKAQKEHGPYVRYDADKYFLPDRVLPDEISWRNDQTTSVTNTLSYLDACGKSYYTWQDGTPLGIEE